METLVEREAARETTEMAVTCRIYSSRNALYPVWGILRNCSLEGAYVESGHAFKKDSMLILKIESSPVEVEHCVDTATPLPRSCLMEVKWCHELESSPALKYGMGLRKVQIYT